MKYAGMITRENVVDNKTFARYVQQRLGVPYPTTKNLVILNKAVKSFFEEYPHLGYESLCNLVDWAKAKNKRFGDTYVLVNMYRYAWQDGFMPELDPIDPEAVGVQEKEDYLLEHEEDSYWRNKMLDAQTFEAKTAIYESWEDQYVGT